MKVFFPDGYTEAHRTEERQADLHAELTKLGLEVETKDPSDCDVTLCGTIWQSERVKEAGLPYVHYCWDLYPWQIEGRSIECWKSYLWGPYLTQLRDAAAIVVPGKSTAERVKEYVGRESTVVHAPVKPWPAPSLSREKGVVDVMRKYPDPNRHAVRDACRRLGVPWLETGAGLSWEFFQHVVSHASVLASVYFEASTGGLTLLEGYALGKPVILCNSPYSGTAEYFPDGTPNTRKVQWDDPKELEEAVLAMHSAKPHSKKNALDWVKETYSDTNFAKGLLKVLERVTT